MSDSQRAAILQSNETEFQNVSAKIHQNEELAIAPSNPNQESMSRNEPTGESNQHGFGLCFVNCDKSKRERDRGKRKRKR